MNENVLKGKWTEIKGEIQKAWGKLTGDELDQASGSFKSLSGAIRNKYGQQQKDIDDRLTDIIRRHDDSQKTDHPQDSSKEIL